MLSTNIDLYYEEIDKIMNSDLYACLTGSTVLPREEVDRENWEEEPDIDIYAYNENAWVEAVNYMLREGYVFGATDSTNPDLEKWKYNKTIKDGLSRKQRLSTVKLNKNGITVNVSVKKYDESALDIIADFDMTCIMRAYDIPNKTFVDLRHGPDGTSDVKVGYPNPYRHIDYSIYTTPWYVRQFDRVIKYWNRGFNTIPTAKKYLEMIDDTLQTGQMFSSESFQEDFEEFKETWIPLRDKIAAWIKDKEECND